MKPKPSFIVLVIIVFLAVTSPLLAQELGPPFEKVKEGIYLYVGKDGDSHCGIILSSEGVVLIDSGNAPTDSRAIFAATKKLSSLPVRFLINTETHSDHTTGNFVFSPPAVVINHAGASEGMKRTFDPELITKLTNRSPEMRQAVEGFRLVTPHIEYHDKLTLTLGGRTFELLDLKNLHSEADTAVWLPEERILFAASIVLPNSRKILRPPITISDMLSAIRMMRSLQPEIVIPGHGLRGTTVMFDDAERYYETLLERVRTMVHGGRSLDQIKQELQMPEYDNWANPDRIPNNIEAAYREITQNR